MPELPDIELYRHALRSNVVDRVLERVRLASPFVLRSVDPSIDAVEGKRVLDVRRLGKRLVFVLEEDLYLVLHLMIAGRLRWKTPGHKIPGRMGLGAFDRIRFREWDATAHRGEQEEARLSPRVPRRRGTE
jgi:formamidopyrimidine-DNA glycosylase